jgi:hypothetical protein
VRAADALIVPPERHLRVPLRALGVVVLDDRPELSYASLFQCAVDACCIWVSPSGFKSCSTHCYRKITHCRESKVCCARCGVAAGRALPAGVGQCA